MHDFLQQLILALEALLPPEFPLSLVTFILACLGAFFSVSTILLLFLHYNLRKRWRHRGQEIQLLRREAASHLSKLNDRKINEARLVTLLKNERKHATEKLRLLEEARVELSLQFENVAGRILDEKSIKFSDLNKEKIDTLLTPFSLQLESLKQEINAIYRSDSRERMSLKSEILQLRDLNEQINSEAINLTRALKNDTKVQGNWGELVLERILECSGLKKGQEYETQTGYRDDSGHLRQPDVIIHLPDGKDIIIDSKVSLTSWERFVNSDAEKDQRRHLLDLVKSVHDHIKGLSNKNYPRLRGVHSLDFVLMFMPIEAAFRTVCEQDDSLLLDALSRNVIIVTPTTLMATLRTIENIWQFEHQSKNSMEIARRAGRMYDKFRGFLEDMEKIERQLATLQGSYDNALAKLTRGRGNLIAQAEQLKDLGVQAKKELPTAITERTEFSLKDEQAA